MEQPSTEAKPRRHRHHKTVVSPALARDLRRTRRLAPLLIIGGLLVAAYLIALFASGLVMGPQEAWKLSYAPARRYGLSPDTVSFQSADGVPLKAWWERPWSVPEPKGVVIVIHGAQANKTAMSYTAVRLLTQGFSVLAPDMRAHGESGGDYSTFGNREALDVEAAVRWVRKNSSSDRIALLGFSSGAVAALLVASRTPDIAAVVADSAFPDTMDVLRRENEFLANLPASKRAPWFHRLRVWFFTAPGFSWLSREAFRLRTGVPFDPPEADVMNAVRHIDRIPVLYLASAADPMVPREATMRLYRATASPRKQLSIQPGAFHSAIGGDPPAYIAAVTAFLDNAFGTQPVFESAAAGQR
jgi:hypothetical protein